MRIEDLAAVHEIERASFTTPWPATAYRTELESNRLAHYLVVRAGEEVIGYAGLWLVVDEAHVTTFAVTPAWRRRGVGERLLLAALDLALAAGAREATLEVRLSNLPARRLYEKYGFRPVGIRPRYYSDDNEDALIMTTEPLGQPAMTARIAARRAELLASGGDAVEPPDDDGQDPGTQGAGRPGAGRPGIGAPGRHRLEANPPGTNPPGTNPPGTGRRDTNPPNANPGRMDPPRKDPLGRPPGTERAP